MILTLLSTFAHAEALPDAPAPTTACAPEVFAPGGSLLRDQVAATFPLGEHLIAFDIEWQGHNNSTGFAYVTVEKAVVKADKTLKQDAERRIAEVVSRASALRSPATINGLRLDIDEAGIDMTSLATIDSTETRASYAQSAADHLGTYFGLMSSSFDGEVTAELIAFEGEAPGGCRVTIADRTGSSTMLVDPVTLMPKTVTFQDGSSLVHQWQQVDSKMALASASIVHPTDGIVLRVGYHWQEVDGGWFPTRLEVHQRGEAYATFRFHDVSIDPPPVAADE